MRGKLLLFLFTITSYFNFSAFAQDLYSNPILSQSDTVGVKSDNVIPSDTVKQREIILTPVQAVHYLENRKNLGSSDILNESVRSAIRRLVSEASNQPYDSTKVILRKFVSDITEKPAGNDKGGVLIKPGVSRDSLYRADSLMNVFPADSMHIVLLNDTITPPVVISNDSIRAAIGTLIDYIDRRDSSILTFTGSDDKGYSLWINNRSDNFLRFWLKNELNDSVTVWIGNPSRDTIGLYLEKGVTFRRPMRQGNVTKASIDYQPQDNKNLVDIGKIITKSSYWTDRTETSFALNQGLLSNWVKGGESNISTTLDVTRYADYVNKPKLITSNNFVRLKYGLIKSGDEKIRKNVDLLETNSKISHKAFGKFDFSGIMLIKTQIGKNYNYPNDSVPVSKFINPAIVTLGLGLDYKPNKTTSITFSPLSYKGTFVPDTAHIDQTIYGIDKDRRSKHEPGVSFLISNEFKPLKSVSVTNRLQLFTNYIHNPQNIDVDWEMILKASLNWFTELRLNTHLIFDDDTKTAVLDKDKNPVLGNDGLVKKTARVQFKELLGLSFVFKF